MTRTTIPIDIPNAPTSLVVERGAVARLGAVLEASGVAVADRRVLLVVNALKAIGLLMDESSEAPPDGIADRVTALGSDPVGDVRAAANAVAGKISRLSTRVVPATDG